MPKEILSKLQVIQSGLRAPKSQYNQFGKYKYRKAEDILEAVKPLLKETGCVLLISDDITFVEGRFYIKATATLRYGEEEVSTTAFARETDTKTGMDAAQVTGSSSSYARKYALNGLFCIDDNADPDVTNTHGSNDAVKQAIDYLNGCKSISEVNYAWEYYKDFYSDNQQFKTAYLKKKKELTNGSQGK